MLKFILGGPGSGKTQKIIENIKDNLYNEEKVILIVPEQDALSCERLITEAMPANKNLLSLEITNFRRLPNLVFRALGGLCSNEIDSSGICVLMWRTLCELSDSLSFFKDAKKIDIGFITELIKLFSEFSDYNITPEKLENVTLGLNGALRRKVEDLAMIYTRFYELRLDGYSDSNDDLRRAGKLLTSSDIFDGANVYIDSFAGFTPCEFEFIKVLIKKCSSVTISLCIDQERDTEIFENVIDTKRNLINFAQDIHTEVETVNCNSPKREDDLELYGKYAFDYYSSPNAEIKNDTVEIFCCNDVYNECELVCADIANEIRNGRRYRDLRIVAGSLSDYDGILEPIMKKHHIPVHFTERDDICSHPLFKSIISAINIIAYNYQIEDVLNFIKTGYSPVDERYIGMLEEYLYLWGLKGNAWNTDTKWTLNPLGMTEMKLSENDEVLDVINTNRDKIRNIIGTLKKNFKKDMTGKGVAATLYGFIVECVNLEDFEEDDTEVYNCIISVLEQIAKSAENTVIDSVVTIKKLFKLCASTLTYSKIPSAIDEINCFGANSMRGGSCKKVYLIGANEGKFPAQTAINGLLLKNERDFLRLNCSMKLSGIASELETEGIFNFYRAVLSASEKVWISYNSADFKGEELYASSGIFELKRLFGANLEIKSDYPREYLIYDIPSALDYLNGEDEMLKATAKKIIADSEYSYLLSNEQNSLETGECYVSERSDMGNINVSYSKIDTYVRCPFMYELSYVIKINEQKKQEYDPRDIGNFIHYLLEKFLSENKDLIAKSEILSEEYIQDSVNRIVEEYIDSVFADRSLMSARIRAMFERLRASAVIFVKSLLKEFENSDFKPVFFELPIGNDEGDISPYVIKNTDGTNTTVYGQIDRVDAYEKDGKLYFRIVDYKTGSKEFSPSDIQEGKNLQMFLYLFSIMQDKDKFKKILHSDAEPIPSGVLYYMAKYKPFSLNTVTDEETLKQKTIDGIKRYGMITDEVDIVESMSKDGSKISLPEPFSKSKANVEYYQFNAEKLSDINNEIITVMSEITAEIKSGKVNAQPNEVDVCRYCRYKPICRKNSAEESENE